MKKLKLQVQISVDGFIAGPNGEMDWMVRDWDGELKKFVADLTEPIDCIVLGRKLAEAFIPYWTNVAANPNDPEFNAGKKFSDTNKVVFTKTREKSEWDNTVLAKGALREEIRTLKGKVGGDIITYGGGEFVTSLIRENLIDEYYLLVDPTALGAGMTIFPDRKKFQPVSCRSFDCGIVLLKYLPIKKSYSNP